MEERLILFLVTLIAYGGFVFISKKGFLPKALTIDSGMGLWSKLGYSLFGILVCYVTLRVISQGI